MSYSKKYLRCNQHVGSKMDGHMEQQNKATKWIIKNISQELLHKIWLRNSMK